jgi:hypothetical protein
MAAAPESMDGGLAMQIDNLVLAQLLVLSGLIAGTAEYSLIIRRRAARRALDTQRAAVEASGLQGLVRVFLADHSADHSAHRVRG